MYSQFKKKKNLVPKLSSNSGMTPVTHLPLLLCFPSQDVNVLAVSDIRPASVYRLAIRAIAADGEGPAISRTFQTPEFQHVLLRPRKYD